MSVNNDIQIQENKETSRAETSKTNHPDTQRLAP
jgi:hypothetical protein